MHTEQREHSYDVEATPCTEDDLGISFYGKPLVVAIITAVLIVIETVTRLHNRSMLHCHKLPWGAHTNTHTHTPILLKIVCGEAAEGCGKAA